MTTQVRIHYFAVLREERGQSEEVFETSATSAHELYAELRKRYSFSLDTNQLAVAVNDEFAKWDHVLKPNDTVVFIPPVAGG